MLPRWPLFLSSLLIFTAHPAQAQCGPATKRTGDTPCGAVEQLPKAQAAADAAAKAYSAVAEPDWDKIPASLQVAYHPDRSDKDREERLQEMLQKLRSDVAAQKAILGNLSSSDANVNAYKASNRESLLKTQLEKKREKVKEAMAEYTRLQNELNAMGSNPGNLSVQSMQRIKVLKQTIKTNEQKAMEVTGLDDEWGRNFEYIMDTVRARVGKKGFKDFNTPEVLRKKKLLEEATKYDDIKKAQANLNESVEIARTYAKKVLAEIDSAEKELKELGDDKSNELIQQRDAKEAEVKAAKAKVTALTNQHPTQADLDAAHALTEKTAKLSNAAMAMEDALQVIRNTEPWIKQRVNKVRTEKLLDLAKDDLAAAEEAKEAALNRAKAGLQAEQDRINRVKASLQGSSKTPAYYQKMSQMTLHARASYEVIMFSLLDYECFSDVRSFMDDLKARMARLEAARDKLIQEASLITKPTKPVKPNVIKPVKPTQPQSTAKIWICDGPEFSKTSRFSVSAGSATFKVMYDGVPGDGTISWKGVPMQIAEGADVELTMETKSTGTGSATGWFASNTWNTFSYKPWDNVSASLPQNDKSSPAGAHVKFKFYPNSDKPFIQIVCAMNEGYIQDVYYNYRRK